MDLPTLINAIKRIPHEHFQTFFYVPLDCVHFHLLRPLGVGLEQVTHYGGEDTDAVQLTMVLPPPDVPLTFSGRGAAGEGPSPPFPPSALVQAELKPGATVFSLT